MWKLHCNDEKFNLWTCYFLASTFFFQSLCYNWLIFKLLVFKNFAVWDTMLNKEIQEASVTICLQNKTKIVLASFVILTNTL